MKTLLPLPIIRTEEELDIGRYYYLTSKESKETIILRCDKLGTSPKFFGDNIWAGDTNPQAFKKWDIRGPVPSHKELCALAGRREDGSFLPAEKSPFS